MAALTLIFTPIIVWPLNSAFLMLEDSIGYTFTGPDAFAIQVMNICTGEILIFIAIAVTLKTLVYSKAENSGQVY